MSAGKPSIKAVTFDLWETLLFEKSGANSRRNTARCKSLAQALNKFGVKISVKQLALALKEMSPWLVSVWEKSNEVTNLDQIRFIITKASKGLITIKEEWIDELSSAYVSPLFEVPPYLNPDAHRVLQQLKDRNKLIGLICNTGLTLGFGLRRFLAREGVAKYFDLMLFSDEVGIRKPDPRIFHIVAQKLNVKPYEIVHVGDNLKNDVWGAKNAGLKAIYLLTETGRDKIAESDPTSLLSISRKLGNLKEEEIVPDMTVTSLTMVAEAMESLDRQVG